MFTHAEWQDIRADPEFQAFRIWYLSNPATRMAGPRELAAYFELLGWSSPKGYIKRTHALERLMLQRYTGERRATKLLSRLLDLGFLVGRGDYYEVSGLREATRGQHDGA